MWAAQVCRPYGIRGTLQLSVGAGPRPARGRTLCAPTVETGPGTLVRKRQAQKHNRTNSNFLPAQAPSGAGRDRTQALLILRAGTVLPASRGNPRKMGSGESGPMDLGGAKRSRSPSAASPVAFCLLFRHGKRRSPPAGGEISRAQQTQSELCPLIRPLRGHLSLSPLAFGHLPLTRGVGPQGEGRIKERPVKSPQKNLHLSPRNFPQAVIQCLLKKYW